MEMYQAIINTPVCKLKVSYDKVYIHNVSWYLGTSVPYHSNDQIILNLINELQNYFDNPLYKINCKTKLSGTVFQNRVWRSLKAIPSGKTLTYGDLAAKLNSAPQAIGQACKYNPLPLIVPCHRIIAKQDLGGFLGKTSGKLLDIKALLLDNESRSLN